MADGLKTLLGSNTWPIVRDLVDEIITVDESEIKNATALMWGRMKLCIEPSAGVGVACVLSEAFERRYPGAVRDGRGDLVRREFGFGGVAKLFARL